MDRRKRRRFFDDFFWGLDEELERIKEHLDSMFERAIRVPFDEKTFRKPFVYGFSIRMGPDGIPHIEEFGNTKPRRGMERVFSGLEGREPLTDIIEAEDSISITVELPGVEKEDIDLNATENSLTIHVDTEERKYHKEIDLPAEVDPESTTATYKNGVLDITLKRIKEKPKKGKRVVIK